MSYSAKSDRILIINGPNLNLLGKREPDIYGTDTMDDILCRIRKAYPLLVIEYFQSNHEGAIIDELHRVGYSDTAYRGVVLNAGAYTHTSLAIADAIAAIPVPVIEVHISNVHSREAVRHNSMISAVCRGVIAGFGADSYRLAVDALSI
jgi:3-dehydroquinate dehydratase-2